MSQIVIGDISPYTQATAIASQTVFGTNWTANYYSDVVVYQTPSGTPPNDVTQILAYPADYSVSFIGDQQQVQVTLVTGANAGDIITITRNTPADRENLYSNTNFTPSMLNNDFGILTLVDQQAQLVNQLIGPRYNYSAVITDVVDTILPILTANQIWAKNSNNTSFVGITIGTAAALNATNPALPYVSSADGPFTVGHVLVAGDTLGTVIDSGSFAGIGSVTNVATGTGLTGGPIVTTGTISFAPIAAHSFWANITGSTAVPTVIPFTDITTVGTITTGTWEGSIIGISYGGTGVNTLPTTSSPSAFAAWDANSNISAVNFISGYATTVNSGTTTTLTVGSAQSQFFTGSANQTVKMPVASTLTLGQYWNIVNNSTGTITIESSGSNTIVVLPENTETTITCILTSGTSASSWVVSPASDGSGTVNSGTQYQMSYYAETGTAVSGLSTAANGVLSTSSGGVPSITSTLPSTFYATISDQEVGTSTTAIVTPSIQNYHPSACWAWASVSQSGGTYTVGNSYNVASVTKNSTGILTVVMTNPFVTTPYVVNTSIQDSVNAISRCNSITSSSTFVIEIINTLNTNVDSGFSFSCFGQ